MMYTFQWFSCPVLKFFISHFCAFLELGVCKTKPCCCCCCCCWWCCCYLSPSKGGVANISPLSCTDGLPVFRASRTGRSAPCRVRCLPDALFSSSPLYLWSEPRLDAPVRTWVHRLWRLCWAERTATGFHRGSCSGNCFSQHWFHLEKTLRLLKQTNK